MGLKKRFIILLTFVLIVAFTSQTFAFNDLDNHWANEVIGELTELGAIGGYSDGTFKPNNPITRAEFCKILTTSLGHNKVVGSAFDDTITHWSKDNINTLVKLGIIEKSEYGNTYEPDKNITRVEIAKMIVRAAGLNDKAIAMTEQNTGFKDNSSIKSSDSGFVILAKDNELIGGYPDNTFKPQANATRAEASVMIFRTLELIEKSPKEEIKSPIDKKLEERGGVTKRLPIGTESSAKYQDPKTQKELIENLESLKENEYKKVDKNADKVEMDQIVANTDEQGGLKPLGAIKAKFPNYEYELSTMQYNGVTYTKLTCDQMLRDEFSSGYLIKDGEIIGQIARVGGYAGNDGYFSYPKDLGEKAEYLGFYRPANYYLTGEKLTADRVLVVFDNLFKD